VVSRRTHQTCLENGMERAATRGRPNDEGWDIIFALRSR